MNPEKEKTTVGPMLTLPEFAELIMAGQNYFIDKEARESGAKPCPECHKPMRRVGTVQGKDTWVCKNCYSVYTAPLETAKAEARPIKFPPCPWPERVWPSTMKEVGDLLAHKLDPTTLTAVSGTLMRHGWNQAIAEIHRLNEQTEMKEQAARATIDTPAIECLIKESLMHDDSPAYGENAEAELAILKADVERWRRAFEEKNTVCDQLHREGSELAIERDKLKSRVAELESALEHYATCSDGCTCGDGWSHDLAVETLARLGVKP